MPADLSLELCGLGAGASSRLRADWLELTAFFSSRGHARFRDLIAEMDIAADHEVDDIGQKDSDDTDTITEVIDEIERRDSVLEGAYPFSVSDDGAVLALKTELGVGHHSYLFSLVMSHLPRSEIVPDRMSPTVKQLVKARDVFQICAVLAIAGYTRGPAYSVGWPRPDKSRFHDKIKEIWLVFGDGVPHDATPTAVPRKIKDGGIDVISWFPEPDGEPGHGHLIGQVASGHDWPGKSVIPDMLVFRNTWFSVQPAGQAHAAIVMPFLLSHDEMVYQTPRHGFIIHRGRLPRLAQQGMSLAAGGLGVERLDESHKIESWLFDYKSKLQAKL